MRFHPTREPDGFTDSMNRKRFAPVVISSSALMVLVLAVPLLGQKPPQSGEALQIHPEAKAAIDRIKSPYCPGLMLEVCTSSGGAMLRDSIQRMAVAGLRSDSIVELVLAEYGEEWRAEPLKSGTGLWAWLLPPMALLIGLGGVGLFLVSRKSPRRTAGVSREVGEDEERRLREALRELEKEEEPVF